ncbi:hypothetical protein Tco_1380064 [Tanacetum coccineum]
MTQLCYVYFPSPSPELQRGGWTNYPQEPSTPGIYSKTPPFKGGGVMIATNKLDNLRREMKKLKENVHAIQVGCENCGGAHLNKECSLHEEVKSVEEVKNKNASLKNLETHIERLAKDYKAKAANRVQDSSVGQCKAIFANNEALTYEASFKGTNELQGVSFISDDNVTIGDPNETMILGRPFLATIHARIDVFDKEISLGVGNDRIAFNMNGNVHHSVVLAKNACMISDVQGEESFNPLEIGNGVLSKIAKEKMDDKDS